MRVLVIEAKEEDRATIRTQLASGGHEVVQAVDQKTALAALGHRTFDVIVVESSVAARARYELMGQIRARESAGRIYTIVVSSRPLPGDVRDAFDAGADEFVRRPVARDELLARVDGITRVRRWASRAFTGVETSTDRCPSTLSSYQTIDRAVTAEIAEMIQGVLVPSESKDGAVRCPFAAQIVLSLPSSGQDVVLAVGADCESLQRIGEGLMGVSEADATTARDILREIANASGGLFKRLAAAEGLAFSMGVPKDVDPADIRDDAARERRLWRATSPAGLELAFEVEIRARKTQQLPVTELREGMVLAGDMVSARGVVILRTGTILMRSHLERLPTVLGERALVAVSAAA
jgi:CheY-like chemotaxis protein